MRHLSMLLCGASLWMACSAAVAVDERSDDTLAVAQAPLYAGFGTRFFRGPNGFGNRRLPVCIEPPDAPSWDGFAAEQSRVEGLIGRNWQAASGAIIQFKGACPTSGGEPYLRLRHRGRPAQMPSAGGSC